MIPPYSYRRNRSYQTLSPTCCTGPIAVVCPANGLRYCCLRLYLGSPWARRTPRGPHFHIHVYNRGRTHTGHHRCQALACTRLVQYGDIISSKRALPSLCIKWTALRLASEQREQAPAVISTLVLADVSLCGRNCAQAAYGRFCTQRRACLTDACAPCEAMAQQTGWATKMAAQHPAPGRCCGCSLCTRAVTTRQATKTPAQYAGTGKPQASPPAKRHAKPLRGPAA